MLADARGQPPRTWLGLALQALLQPEQRSLLDLGVLVAQRCRHILRDVMHREAVPARQRTTGMCQQGLRIAHHGVVSTGPQGSASQTCVNRAVTGLCRNGWRQHMATTIWLAGAAPPTSLHPLVSSTLITRAFAYTPPPPHTQSTASHAARTAPPHCRFPASPRTGA